MADLFDDNDQCFLPLAARMRPVSLEEYVGQEHILSPGKPLYQTITNGRLHSFLLWGPPGTGKTSFAKMVSNATGAEFFTLSAVLTGVSEIKECIHKAQNLQRMYGRRSILFIDEVHRFNKSQQDIFLPYIENGTIIFIGATTENPSFEINNALLSRIRVYQLRKLENKHLDALIDRALLEDNEIKAINITISDDVKKLICQLSDGDARRLFNLLETATNLLVDEQGAGCTMTKEFVLQIAGDSRKSFDKGGDLFYEQISALHKSIRGSDPDAALYWVTRMLDGGCDPYYICRRLIRVASEDIGNADPKALQITLNAWESFARLGAPEGLLVIAHAVVYLSVAPKSNAVYCAYKSALALVRESADSLDVPIHLRNAPTALMKEQGYGDEYRYAHDDDDAFAAGESYFPESLNGTRFYHPVSRGLEVKIEQKLEVLRRKNLASKIQRY